MTVIPQIGQKLHSNRSWYDDTAIKIEGFQRLEGDMSCDVCVVGAGYTGLMASLELAEKGYNVVLLESRTVGWGASGRNGGQLIRAYRKSFSELTEKYSPENKRLFWEMNVESINLLASRVKKHGIDCELRWGNVVAALRPSHMRDLREDFEEWQSYGCEDLRMLDQTEIRETIASDRYIGGMLDMGGGQIHPLSYARGLANAARQAGVKIFENSPAVSIDVEKTQVITATGTVSAKHIILACNAYIGNLSKKMARRIIAAGTYIIGTERMDAAFARSLIPQGYAIEDARYILDYYRLTPDHRMLFGGSLSYSAIDFPGQQALLERKMRKVFPQLENTKTEYCWGGHVALTRDRMPDLGRLAKNIFYAQGYSGHGIVLSGFAGKLMAEAVAGTAERFDVLAKIPHFPFPGGDLFRRPALTLAMLWFRLKDLL